MSESTRTQPGMCHLAAALCVGLTLLLALPSAAAPPASRAAFAQALSHVQPGMTQAEVAKRLGAPDLRQRVPHGRRAHVRTLWGYGVTRPAGFAALGTVGFNAAARVHVVFGGRGAPASKLSEATLRAHLDRVHAVSTTALGDFNPDAVLQTVNQLLVLGRAGAVGVLEEYLRVVDRGQGPLYGTYWLMRALFDGRSGGATVRAPRLGAPSPAPPKTLAGVPGFPVLIVDDVPFLLVTGYALGGMAERPDDYLELYGSAPLRARPLRPRLSRADRAGALRKATARIYGSTIAVALRQHLDAQLQRQPAGPAPGAE